MRTKLVLAATLLGAAGVVLPATSASAYCDPIWSELTGRCDNGCTVTARIISEVSPTVGQQILCPM